MTPARVLIQLDVQIARAEKAEAEAEQLRKGMENGDRLLSQAGREIEQLREERDAALDRGAAE